MYMYMRTVKYDRATLRQDKWYGNGNKSNRKQPSNFY